MYYDIYDYPSAVTEERLASIVCASVNESVKDYLSETNGYVKRLRAIISEHQETIDALTSDREALRRRVVELEECLKACTAAPVKHIYNRCEVTQNYQSEQTHIVSPTFGSMYNVHGNEVVNAG